MINVKYRNESKAVLIEVDMVHGDINCVMMFDDVTLAKRYCQRTHKVFDWNFKADHLECYIDETRRLEIRSVREVSEF
jgi:hypothetical protein